MKAKPLITAVLCVFVVASIGYAVYGELNGAETPVSAPEAAATPAPVTEASAPAETAPAAVSAPVVKAYYFHGTQRCVTCRAIETNTEAALKASFADELAAGAMTWSSINLDQPENTHFMKDFELSMNGVVLAEVRDGQVMRWANLTRVWELARDSEKLQAYVRAETAQFLRGDLPL